MDTKVFITCSVRNNVLTLNENENMPAPRRKGGGGGGAGLLNLFPPGTPGNLCFSPYYWEESKLKATRLF